MARPEGGGAAALAVTAAGGIVAVSDAGAVAVVAGDALPAPIVVDTNIALDLLVFADPSWAALHAGLAAGALRWIATPAMRAELARVLGYPLIARRLLRDARAPEAVLAAFDARRVALLRADWTRQDPAITAALRALGRSGVPVYVLQAPGRAPVVLTEILGRDEVRAALGAL